LTAKEVILLLLLLRYKISIALRPLLKIILCCGFIFIEISCKNDKNLIFTNDYATGLALAKNRQQLILLIFDSYGVCDHSTDKMLASQKVKNILAEKYTVIRLFVDDNGKNYFEEKIGLKNALLQNEKYHSFVQPFFYIIDNQENIVASTEYSRENDFLKFLEKNY
jgi:thioredoxin-related protein